MVASKSNCENCGAVLTKAMQFCGSCGAQVGASSPLTVEEDVRPSRPAWLYAVGGAIGAALLGGAAYGVYSSMKPKLGSADRNADGSISVEEFRQELTKVKLPQRGLWKMTLESDFGNGNMMRISGETPRCDESFWIDLESGFNEIGRPDSFAELERELRRMSQKGGKFEVQRFEVDGDKIDLKMAGNGEASERDVDAKGDGGLSLKGVISPKRIALVGDGKIDFSMAALKQPEKIAMSYKFSGEQRFTAERIGDCPLSYSSPSGIYDSAADELVGDSAGAAAAAAEVDAAPAAAADAATSMRSDAPFRSK